MLQDPAGHGNRGRRYLPEGSSLAQSAGRDGQRQAEDAIPSSDQALANRQERSGRSNGWTLGRHEGAAGSAGNHVPIVHQCGVSSSSSTRRIPQEPAQEQYQGNLEEAASRPLRRAASGGRRRANGDADGQEVRSLDVSKQTDPGAKGAGKLSDADTAPDHDSRAQAQCAASGRPRREQGDQRRSCDDGQGCAREDEGSHGNSISKTNANSGGNRASRSGTSVPQDLREEFQHADAGRRRVGEDRRGSQCQGASNIISTEPQQFASDAVNEGSRPVDKNRAETEIISGNSQTTNLAESEIIEDRKDGEACDQSIPEAVLQAWHESSTSPSSPLLLTDAMLSIFQVECTKKCPETRVPNNIIYKEYAEYLNRFPSNTPKQQLDLLEIYAYDGSQLTEKVRENGGKALRFGETQGDLSTWEGRQELFKILSKHTVRHIWMAPECRPWSPWSRFNMMRSFGLRSRVLADRAKQKVHLQLCSVIYLHQLTEGEHLHCHLEQPCPSEITSQSELLPIIEYS